MTDPIADMLTRIRNAIAVKKPEIVLPHSKIKIEIAKLLEREKWIKKSEVIVPNTAKQDLEQEKFKQIKLILKYKDNSQSFIKNLKRISKPGLRIYVKRDKIPFVLGGFGMSIISTSHGLMTDREARRNKTGGELICEIW
ncbi:30S ribosomal protein S8 [Patescibacteria group bacterium]|nr:30S ribosomal protein S8 [Patescibacteria group bacterium]